MNQIIVGMGEALWDVLPEGKKIGGAPANFAYHVSQFGFDSRVVSAIGDDKLGNEILENFDGKNLKYQIEKVPYPTGTVQVELDPNGVPMYDIKEGVAWDNIPFTPALEELAKNTRSVCFGSLAQRSVVSRETINRFLDVMPEGEGQCKIFDVNLRQGFYTKEILCNSMKKCNILKINDEELVTVSRMFGYPGIDLQDKCWILLAKYNLKMLILTCGVNGSYVFTPGEISFVETPKVEVADTVGAGDSFTATFLLVTHGNPTSLSISPAALFWGIASAFAAAFYTTYPSTLIARYGTLPVVGWSMLIGGLILLPFYARQGTNFVVNGSLILAFFYLVVIGTSLTFSLYLKGAQLIGGPKASILSCAEPLSSALLSLLLLGITFTLPDWLGTLLILSSVILISMDSRRRARKINRPARHE